MDTIISIILAGVMFTAYGSITHAIMGHPAGLPHNIFIGAAGTLLAEWGRDLLNIDAGVFQFFGSILLGSMLAEWLTRRLKIWWYTTKADYKREKRKK